MTDDYITSFTNSLQEKLGDEQNAIIADDLGTLITKNAETQKELEKLNNEVDRLKGLNEKLVITNGNLLKQVPSEHSAEPPTQKAEDEPSIDLKSAFDTHGNFIK